ncbi:uncharacterized protein LOC129219693 [Uloborus diversus]|uniref:uncharacterized protein LOC129219693 n=1 Tax=Uloborus diversus TaxID=327109 RepID=UPI0024096CC9|nr:uncharacterized protein LOC129219693 [Uloborus diversus]XP_054709952.1 uncharacterized protein LOC129219693 [Uloborus diversus]
MDSESDYEDFDIDSGMCPCEFCEQLYPYELLMEHQSACRPDLLHYSPEGQHLNNPFEQSIVERQSVSLDIEKNKDETIVNTVTVAEKEKSSVVLPNVQKKNIRLAESIKPDAKKEKLHPLRSSDDQLQNNEIMAFGTKKAKEKITNSEKLTFKKPSLPLLNYINNGAKDSCCILAEDDCESLEEFWKRCDIALKQRKNKIKNNI